MRKKILSTIALASAGALILAGCSSRTDNTAASDGTTTVGFDSNATIGVALPSKTSENWVLAGDLFVDGLEEAGFTADVQYAAATGTVADQQAQIQSMVTKGAKVIIIGATDGSQLGTQVKAAHDSGAIVIAYDRMILNTEDVDYYVAYDNFEVGALQGQALLDGMAAEKGEAPYSIELFSGSPDDANSSVFFDGAMSVLQPAIDDGTVIVASGQTTIQQSATEGWKPENAQRRMDALLTSTYATDEVDGVLSPNDTLARAIITSVKSAGKDIPIVTGQDSEVESVKSIVAGEQYSTINKDTRALVSQAIDMAKTLQTGGTPEVNNTTDYDNGSKIVSAYLLPPVIVTKENAEEAYANDSTLSVLTE